MQWSLAMTLWLIGAGIFYWKVVGQDPIDPFLASLKTLRIQDWSVFLSHGKVLLKGISIGVLTVLLGRGLLGYFKLVRQSPWETAALGGGLGIGFLSYVFFLLGALGWLSPFSIGLLVAVLAILALAANRDLASIRVWRDLLDHSFHQRGTFQKICRLFVGIALVMGIFSALSPEIFFDSLVYHLALPKLHLLEGRLTATPHNVYEGIPMAIEFYYGIGLALGNEIVSKLLAWWISVFCLFALLTLSDSERPATGWLASFIFVCTPVVFLKIGVTGNDIGTSFFSLVAVIAAGRLVEPTLPEDTRTRWGYLTGILSGLAMSCKYTVWPFLPALLAALWWALGKNGIPGRSRIVFRISVVAGLVVAPWIVKNLIFYGNPVFPMYNTLFTNVPLEILNWKLIAGDAWGRDLGTSFRSVTGIWQWANSFWRHALSPWENMDSSFTGPLFGLFAPCIFLFRWKRRQDHISIATFLGLFLLWQLTTSMLRHLMPGLAILSVLIAIVVLESNQPRFFRELQLFLIFVSCIFQLMWCWDIHFPAEGQEAVLGKVSREEYLGHAHSSYPLPPYIAMRYINNNTPRESRVLVVGDSRGYYLERPFIAATVYYQSPLVTWAEQAVDARGLARELEKRGITHILVNTAESFRTRGYRQFVVSRRGIENLWRFWGTYTESVFASRNDEPADQRRLEVFRFLGTEGDQRPITPAALPFHYELK